MMLRVRVAAALAEVCTFRMLVLTGEIACVFDRSPKLKHSMLLPWPDYLD